jgi:hypothetical protein
VAIWMTKVFVVVMALAWFVRLRLRRNPRLRARVYPWTLAAVVVLLLLATNPGPGTGRLGTAFHLAKLAGVVVVVGYLVYDIRRALEHPARMAASMRGRGPSGRGA